MPFRAWEALVRAAVTPGHAAARPRVALPFALVLRRDRVEAAHFRAPTVLPVVGIASCLLLLARQEAGTSVRAGVLLAVSVLLAVGVLLHAGTQAAHRRRDRVEPREPSVAG